MTVAILAQLGTATRTLKLWSLHKIRQGGSGEGVRHNNVDSFNDRIVCIWTSQPEPQIAVTSGGQLESCGHRDVPNTKQ